MHLSTLTACPPTDGPSPPPPPDPSLVEYLGLVNRLIDGLSHDSQSFDRVVMVLSAMGHRVPPSVANLVQLFEHLRREGLCGPNNLGLLETVLKTINKPHLLRLVQEFTGSGDGGIGGVNGPSRDEQSHENRKVCAFASIPAFLMDPFPQGSKMSIE